MFCHIISYSVNHANMFYWFINFYSYPKCLSTSPKPNFTWQFPTKLTKPLYTLFKCLKVEKVSQKNKLNAIVIIQVICFCWFPYTQNNCICIITRTHYTISSYLVTWRLININTFNEGYFRYHNAKYIFINLSTHKFYFNLKLEQIEATGALQS